MSARAHVRRRIVVDRRFQLHYLWAWLLVSCGVTGLGVAAYLAVVKGLAERVDPDLAAIPASAARGFLLLNAGYLLAISLLMGIYTVIHSHRVAGPAFRLTRHVERIRGGDLDTPVGVRRGDYLQDLAGGLEGLRGDLAVRRESVRHLLEGARSAPGLRDACEAVREQWGLPPS